MVEHEATSWVDKISLGISRVAMWLVALIVAIMFFEVVMRYVFAKRLLGYEELARYSMIWLAFIGAAYATRLRSHIKVDILPLIIKDERTLKKAEIIQDFLSFGFCTVARVLCLLLPHCLTLSPAVLPQAGFECTHQTVSPASGRI